NLDPSAAVFHLRQHTGQYERRVGDRSAERAGMEVRLGPAHVELKIGEAAKAVADRWNTAVEHRGIGNDDDVRSEIAFVGSYDVVEMAAAHLFLAFDEDPYVQRQAAGLLHVRFDRLDVHEDLALVVRRAARINLSVANAGFKRRGRPQIQWIDGLHVVVTV